MNKMATALTVNGCEHERRIVMLMQLRKQSCEAANVMSSCKRHVINRVISH
jgi:hypothetical protein